jgi:hypothetical protein
MATQWMQESCDRRDDPVSGARIIQLTSAAAISNNIYGEQPYTSPDGKRIIVARCNDFCFDEEGSLLVHDLDRLRITMIVRKAVGVRGAFNSAWSGLAYYWTPDRRLVRFNLMTLEQEEVYVEEDPNAPLVGGTVSPDQRYVAGTYPYLKGSDGPTFQVIRLDLQEKKREVILEHPEISNSHLQFNPADGAHLLVQNDRGLRLNSEGIVDRHRQTHRGTTLFVIDKDGKNLQYVPVGPPVTATCTGHECFVAATGKVLFSVGWTVKSEYDWRHDDRFPQGNLFTAKPGDEKPQVIEAPEHFFNHVCASRDGRYFVADAHPAPGLFKNGRMQPVALVVGNLETGKYRTLVEDSQASSGGNQCTHTHPYLTADNRHVIYNADPGGVPQVYAARLPEGFLASLD